MNISEKADLARRSQRGALLCTPMRLLLGAVRINYLTSYYHNTTAEKYSALFNRQRGSFSVISYYRAGFMKNSLAQAVSAESIIVRVTEPALARLKPSLAN